MNDERVGWPSAAVAVALIITVGAITVAAIVRYSIDDALKFWAGLSGLVGVVTGVMGSYFFTRRSVASAEASAATAREREAEATAEASLAKKALGAALLEVDPSAKSTLMDLPSVRGALGA